jgi:hypothetical protein
MAAEEWSIQRDLAALREGQAVLEKGQAALEKGQAHLAAELDRTRRVLREDSRDLRTQVAAVQNGQFVFAGATVAGLLGVIATLIAT